MINVWYVLILMLYLVTKKKLNPKNIDCMYMYYENRINARTCHIIDQFLHMPVLLFGNISQSDVITLYFLANTMSIALQFTSI